MKIEYRIFLCCFITVILMMPASDSCASIPEFFEELFLEFEADYAAHAGEAYEQFCAEYQLDASSDQNWKLFMRIHFLHDLLTTTSAGDCARGGILRIPYFWHWVDPNPRHSIIALPDSNLLSAKSPPPQYGRYGSFADIDRVPALFLGDLVSQEPGYYHPGCGLFNTFGWCSEREMSFASVMIAWGYKCKIWQEGIHTYSVVWCKFVANDGNYKNIEARVDNTFDTISWRALPDDTRLGGWIGDIGDGGQISWYNEKARSSEQLKAICSIPVGDRARKRIRDLVSAALR